MRYRRERPICRQHIEKILAERKCTLKDLLEHPHRLSTGMRTQARKMLDEQRLRKEGVLGDEEQL